MTEQEKMSELAKLKEISADRQRQKDLMKKNGDNSHEMLSEGNYTDPQHFVYELLQNAEDEIAKKVCFELQNDKMIFTHDSKHLFEFGDIVAISNFGDKDSPKRRRENAIGRYGIGFKSVLAITEEPRVQSGIFDVSIKERFVPVINDVNYYSDKTTITLPLKTYDLYDVLLKKFKSINGDEIIFLNNIVELKIIIDNQEVIYTKTEKDNILTITKNNTIIGKYLLLSKDVNVENKNLPIKIILGIENNKITSLQKPLYVFFPTKDETNLSFVLHAPFKLATHTREHIDKEYENNKKLLEELANLFADNLDMSREKGYIDVDFFNDIFPFRQDKANNQIYKLFCDKCLAKLQDNKRLIPTNDNNYASIESGMFVGSAKLVELLCKEHLVKLFTRQDWISDKITPNVHKELYNFLRELKIPDVDLKYFLNKLNEDFLSEQSDEWLIRFYKTFCEIKIDKEKNVEEVTEIISESQLQNLPIIRTSKDGIERQMVLPKDAFLPPNISNLFSIVISELLQDNVVEQFLNKLGIEKPKNKDEIRKIIEEEDNLYEYFEIIFDYWKDEKPQQIIDDIKKCGKPFLKIQGNKEYCKASELYFPTEDLVAYFETKPNTKFVDFEYYKSIFKDSESELERFLEELNARFLPIIDQREIIDVNEKMGLKLEKSTHGYDDRQKTIDKFIDGSKEILSELLLNEDCSSLIKIEKSKLFWKILCLLKTKHYNSSWDNLETKLTGKHEYFYYSKQLQNFETEEIKRIRKSQWLLNKSSDFVAPHEITVEDLAEGYDLSNADSLIKLLQFKPSISLTIEQRIAQKFKNEEEAEEARIALEEKRARQNASHTNCGGYYNDNSNSDNNEYTNKKLDAYIQNLDSLEAKKETQIENRIEQIKEIETEEKSEITDEELYKKIEEKAKAEQEIIKKRKLLGIKLKTNKYSYEWFCSYLELLLTYGEKQSTDKKQTKSLSFQKIKAHSVDGKVFEKYFMLSDAGNYDIPSNIDDCKDFQITLLLKNNQKENISVESVSKRGQNLLIHCPKGIPQPIIDQFNDVVKVEIKFTPVIDLLEKLSNAFDEKFIDKWEDIKETLPALHYIYGPPGTGKTTTLCKKIDEILVENSDVKILILTPTNKASDVICQKLDKLNVEICKAINAEKNIFYWEDIKEDLLTPNTEIKFKRLGSQTEPELKEENYTNTLDVNSLDKISIVASTIHRLPYFEINQLGKLFQAHWDYVIFDESSMTGLHYIVFAIMALYKTNPDAKFIIAGDPKQIPPVIEVTDKELENFDFQDENIYTMMGLDKKDSFKEAKQLIRQDKDKIDNLDKQFRSIQQIGQLFSELSYSTLLKHDREENRKETKPLPENFKKIIFKNSNVAFIDTPLKDDSIYKINTLNGSSYQTYCAILVAEIIKFFDKGIAGQARNDEKVQWKIGLIAPYKAQAMLLNKLIADYGISENITIYAATAHGFQGDECDIVFFVCNPNNYKYTGYEKCLLSKEYIYNVAISRAKDYLIILHPFSTIDNNYFINQIAKSYKDNFAKDDLSIIQSSEIEKELFETENYIYKYSNSTGHDSVNVFGTSDDIKYFIKASDNAIDIQIKK